jgi:hypothetical protein
MSSESLIMLRATTSISTVDAAAAVHVSIPWAVVPGGDWTGAVDGVERLKGLMARCLHAEPSRRPSMDDFLADLDVIRNPPLVPDGGYGEMPGGTSGYATVIGSDATVTVAAAAIPASAAASTAGVSTMSTAPRSAAYPVDVVDMSQALAAMDALQIASDVADRVCDEMVLAAAEVGHVTGAQFLQIVIDEGVKSALAMRLREKLRITSVVPPRKVRCDALCCQCVVVDRIVLCRRRWCSRLLLLPRQRTRQCQRRSVLVSPDLCFVHAAATLRQAVDALCRVGVGCSRLPLSPCPLLCRRPRR